MHLKTLSASILYLVLPLLLCTSSTVAVSLDPSSNNCKIMNLQILKIIFMYLTKMFPYNLAMFQIL